MTTQDPDTVDLVYARVVTDDEFRAALLADPAGTLAREFAVTIPDGVRIEVHEETRDVIQLIVPGREIVDSMPESSLGSIAPSIWRNQPGNGTVCCTCGYSTAQTLVSWQKGCGCA